MSSVSVEGVTLKLRRLKPSEEDNAFLIKKLERSYQLTDYDGDGIVSRADFIAMLGKAANIAGVTFTSKMSDAAASAFDALYGNAQNFTTWRVQLISKIDDGTITEEKHAKLITPMFKAIDLNGNGVISWDEYRAFSLARGHSEADAHYGFGMVDSNGDGLISYDEFCHAAFMYHTDRTDSKWKHFLGRWKDENTSYSAFQIEKMRRAYEKFDFNKDGYVKREDFDLWLERYAEKSAFELTDVMKQAMREFFDAFFEGTSCFDEWKDKFLGMMKEPDFTEYASKVGMVMLKAIDVDNNEIISWEEYKAWMCSLGATEAAAHYGFSEIDINGDGKLSLEEFPLACLRYFTDKGDSRFKHFYGKYLPNDDFLIKKLKRHYKMADIDDNGVVTREDYVKWGKKVMTSQGAPFTDVVKGYWTTACDTLIGECKNFGEWRDHFLRSQEENGRKMSSHRDLAVPLFKAIDVDGNGHISWKEYKSFVMGKGATEAEAHVGFASIDANGDGRIDFEEFAYAEYMYYTDRSDSQYKHFYGEWKE